MPAPCPAPLAWPGPTLPCPADIGRHGGVGASPAGQQRPGNRAPQVGVAVQGGAGRHREAEQERRAQARRAPQVGVGGAREKGRWSKREGAGGAGA